MTNRQRLFSITLVVLLVAGGVAPLVASSAQAQDSLETRSAQLFVDQPHYVDGDVATTTTNGTRTYGATGSPLELHPQNFESGAVIDFGVTTDAGALTYDEQTGEFTLSADETGTYELYWIVAEQTVVERTQNNTTTNVTATQQVRYTARIDLSGPLTLDHVEPGSVEETREDAQKWREFNETVQDLREDNLWVKFGLQPPLSTEETVQEMVNAYLLKNNPTRALSGDITQILLLIALSLGGLFLALIVTGYHTVVVGFLMRKLNRHESVEAEEGAVAEKLEAQRRRERKTSVANQSFADIWTDDFVAEAMSDEGRNPLQAFTNYWGRLSEVATMRWWLQVMGQNGYVARAVDDVPAPDGGTDLTVDEVGALEVVATDDVDDEDVTFDLRDADAGLARALPSWDADVFLEFDLAGAEWDDEELSDDLAVPQSLEDVVTEANIDRRHFDDRMAVAQRELELLQHIRTQTTLTDDRGVVDGLRFWLEQQLDAANVLNDRFDLPLELHIDRLEHLIRSHDEAAEARDTLEDIENGRYS